MRGTSRQREKIKIQPPMTPMIDIIFQLLIFFLLTPTILAEGYLTTNLPKTTGPNPLSYKEVERIKVELREEPPNDENVSIILNDTQNLGSSFAGLQSALRSFRDAGLPPDHPVLIAPTMPVRHKWVVRAFDAAVIAGFSNIHFGVPR